MRLSYHGEVGMPVPSKYTRSQEEVPQPSQGTQENNQPRNPKKRWLRDFLTEDEPHRKFTILGPLLSAPRNSTPLVHPLPLLVHAHPSSTTAAPSTNGNTTNNIAGTSSSTATITNSMHSVPSATASSSSSSSSSSQSQSDGLPRSQSYQRNANTPNQRSNIQQYSPSPSSSSSSFPSTSSSPSPSPSSSSKPSTSRDEKGSPRRAGTGTREVHNKLEKNRRAIMKECFEILRRQLPPMHHSEKKISHLTILHTAVRFIQTLRRKERECEHEMERLAREKIAAQQRLSELKRELTSQWDHLDLNVLLPDHQNHEERQERDSHTTSTATAVHEDGISDSEDLHITPSSSGHSSNPQDSSSRYRDTHTCHSQVVQGSSPPSTTQSLPQPQHIPQPVHITTATQVTQSQNHFSQSFPQTVQQCPPLIQLSCPPLVQSSQTKTTLLQATQPHTTVLNTYQSVPQLGRQVGRLQQPENVISAERIMTSVQGLPTMQPLHETPRMNGPLNMTEPPPLQLCSHMEPRPFSFTGNAKPQPSQILPPTHLTIPVSAQMMNTSGLAAAIVNPTIQLIPSTLRMIPQEPQPLALTVHQPAASTTNDVPSNAAQSPQIAQDAASSSINTHARQLSSQVALLETARLPTAELSLVSTNGPLRGNKLPDGTTVLTSAMPGSFPQATFTHMVAPGLTPIVAPLAVVSQGNQVAHIITTPQIGGKVVTTGPILKSVNAVPIMNAQYLSAATLVKPVVVVSSQSTSPSQS